MVILFIFLTLSYLLSFFHLSFFLSFYLSFILSIFLSFFLSFFLRFRFPYYSSNCPIPFFTWSYFCLFLYVLTSVSSYICVLSSVSSFMSLLLSLLCSYLCLFLLVLTISILLGFRQRRCIVHYIPPRGTYVLITAWLPWSSPIALYSRSIILLLDLLYCSILSCSTSSEC